MTKLFLVLLTAFFAVSCIQPFDLEHLESMVSLLPEFKAFDDAWLWVEKNIKYVSDEGTRPWWDTFKTPEETLEDMCGDCEDIAILLMYFAHEMGVESKLATIYDNTHAIIIVDNKPLDPKKLGYYYPPEIEYVVIAENYEEALYLSRTKSISQKVSE